MGLAADISVIIPAHNEEDYITRCLASVRRAEKQISETVEIVVVLNRFITTLKEMNRFNRIGLMQKADCE